MAPRVRYSSTVDQRYQLISVLTPWVDTNLWMKVNVDSFCKNIISRTMRTMLWVEKEEDLSMKGVYKDSVEERKYTVEMQLFCRKEE